MITNLKYLQGPDSIDLTADTDAYPLNIVVKCFKTQPLPPRLEPCYQYNKAIVTPLSVGFVTGYPSHDGFKTYNLNETIVIDSHSSVVIGTARSPVDMDTPRDMEIHLADAAGDRQKLSFSLI